MLSNEEYIQFLKWEFGYSGSDVIITIDSVHCFFENAATRINTIISLNYTVNYYNNIREYSIETTKDRVYSWKKAIDRWKRFKEINKYV
jgi:hypothetical protein